MKDCGGTEDLTRDLLNTSRTTYPTDLAGLEESHIRKECWEIH